MKRIYVVEGIILKRRNFSEADKLITIFTKERGKITVLAKGVRRVPSRRAPHVELFGHVRLVIHQSRSFDTVLEASQVTSFSSSERTLERLSAAYFLCEVTDRLVAEGEAHAEIFILLVETLDRILDVTNEHDAQEIMRTFGTILLWRLGFISENKEFTSFGLHQYIEYLTERKLHTPNILHQLI